RAMLLVAIVHGAGFVRETLTDIVGVLHDVIAQLLDLGAQLALLRHHQRGGFSGRRFCGSSRRCGRRRRALAALLADDPWRHDRFPDLVRAASRTSHELALDLAVIRRRALEPALESVVLLAAKRVADHAEPRTRCRCSGPDLGSAMPKRRPCC